MLRDFSKALFEHLIAAFPPDRPYPADALEREPMPRAVAHYLAQIVRHHLDVEAEEMDAARSGWFDYEHPDVRRAADAYFATLAAHTVVPAEEWPELLERAVSRTVAYLVRPARTLVEFTFRDADEPLPAGVIFRRLAYFAAYPYMREIVRAYFEQKRLDEIDRARYATLLLHGDRQVTRGYDAAAWLRLLAPLFDLARAVPAFRDGLPAALLVDFFQEKAAEDVVRRLKASGRSSFDESALLALLEASPTPIPERRAARPEPSPLAERVPQPVRPAPTERSAPAGPPAAGEPRWKQYRQAPAGHDAATPPPTPLVEAATESKGVPLWMRFRKQAATTDAADAPDLDRLEASVLGAAGAANRSLFVEHLFAGSVESYQQVLRQLAGAPSWQEATHIIAREVFRRHRINIYSEPAVAFTNAAEAQFRLR